MIDDALKLAAEGLCVFPCQSKSKQPAGWLVPRGLHNASTNPATIKRWFQNNQGYNIAVRCGVASGAWVLDVDCKHGKDGEAALAELVAKHGPLPETRQSQSGTGGRHLWFRCHSPIQSSVDRVAGGIDVRGDGGYVVVPPSIHPDTGTEYVWLNDAPIVEAPAWLVGLARKPKPESPKSISERALDGIPRVRNGSSGAYGAAALRNEIDDLANTPPGSRNHRLNRASFSLFQLVGGGELDGAEVERRLYEAAERNGLVKEDGARAVRATIRSGARAGLQCPRSRGAK